MILPGEPTGNLDSAVGMEILGVFYDLNRLRGVTLLIITHDPRIAQSCPRRLRLQDGKIVTEEQE